LYSFVFATERLKYGTVFVVYLSYFFMLNEKLKHCKNDILQ